MTQWAAEIEALLERLLPHEQGVLVLEAGCGSMSHFRLPAKARLVGIDVSARQLDNDTRLDEKVLGDLQYYEWPADRFDVVVCWDVLEHLPDPVAAMRRMFAATRPGGLLVFAFPNRNSLKGWVTRLTPFAVHAWFYQVIIGDTRRRDELDQFPTYMRRAIAPARVLALAKQSAMSIEYLRIYEGPVQAHLRDRRRLANTAFAIVGAVCRGLTLGRYDPNQSDCVMVLRKK